MESRQKSTQPDSKPVSCSRASLEYLKELTEASASISSNVFNGPFFWLRFLGHSILAKVPYNTISVNACMHAQIIRLYCTLIPLQLYSSSHSSSLVKMTDLSYAVNHALSKVTPYRFLTGAGIGFSSLFFFANVGANIFGLVPIISNPALRKQYGIPIESAVRQWDWFFAKAMVSGWVKERGIS